MKPILSAFFFLLILSASAMPVHADIITANMNDAQVSQYAPTANYGTSTLMGVQGHLTNLTLYIMFNLSSLDPTAINISSVTGNLSLYQSGYYGVGASNLSLYNTSLNWTEENITWNAQPIEGTFISNTSFPDFTDDIKWQNFSIDSALKSAIQSADKILSIKIKMGNISVAGGPAFRTKEYGSVKPFLSISYSNTNGCLSHDVNGTWCDEYNLTPMCTDYLNTSCWNPYTELLPNPFNASKNTFTTFNTIDSGACGIQHSQCPAGYMCIQGSWQDPIPANPDLPFLFPIYTTSLGNNWTWRGIVQCHSSTSLTDLYFNETGDQVNLSDNYPNLGSTCDNPSLWNNNSYACILDGCHYCTQEAVCKRKTNACSNTCLNDTSIGACFDNFCNPVTCSQGTGSNPSGTGTFVGWKESFNSSMGSVAASSLLAVVISLSGGFVVFLKSKSKKLETFVIPFFIFLVIFAMPGIEFFPLWIYMVLVAFTGVMMFWKAKG